MSTSKYPAVVKLASDLIAIDTTTDQGITTAVAFLKSWAKQAGLSLKTFSGTQALLIETQPQAKKHLCFVTHVDVVSANGWTSAFKPKIKNNSLIGRGAVDDKGPLAICLEVLKLSRQLTEINVSCLIITDEEIVNKDISRVLESKTFDPDFCLVADGGTHELLDVGQKGIVKLNLVAKTPGGHSAFEEVLESALLQLLAFVYELRAFGQDQAAAPEFKPTLVNVSKMISESVPYSFPNLAQANLEIQFPPPQTVTMWTKKISELTTKFPSVVADVEWTCEPHSALDNPWLKMFEQFPHIKFITVGGVNLAKDLSLAGIPAVSHCPVTEYMGHCDDERILLADLDRGVETYSQLVKIFSKMQI